MCFRWLPGISGRGVVLLLLGPWRLSVPWPRRLRGQALSVSWRGLVRPWWFLLPRVGRAFVVGAPVLGPLWLWLRGLGFPWWSSGVGQVRLRCLRPGVRGRLRARAFGLRASVLFRPPSSSVSEGRSRRGKRPRCRKKDHPGKRFLFITSRQHSKTSTDVPMMGKKTAMRKKYERKKDHPGKAISLHHLTQVPARACAARTASTPPPRALQDLYRCARDEEKDRDGAMMGKKTAMRKKRPPRTKERTTPDKRKTTPESDLNSITSRLRHSPSTARPKTGKKTETKPGR